MKKRNIFILLSFALVINVLSFSWGKKLNAKIDNYNDLIEKSNNEAEVVNVWMKENGISDTRKLQFEKFNSSNNSTKIAFKVFSEDYFNILRTSLVADNGPDIFEYSYDSEIFKSNKALPLTEMNIDLSNIREDVYQLYEGKAYGINLLGNNLRLVWNKELFRKAGINSSRAPRTWAEVKAMSQKIKKASPDVVPLGFSLNNSSQMDIMLNLGVPSLEEGNIYNSFWNFNEGKYNYYLGKRIVAFYKDMYDNGLVYKNFEAMDRKKIKMDFYLGKAAMIFASYNDKLQFDDVLPLSFGMGMSDIPKFNENSRFQSYFISADNCFLVNSSIVEDKVKMTAVEKVYSYILEDSTNRDILKTEKAMPIALKSISHDGFDSGKFGDVSSLKYQIYDPTFFIGRNYPEDYRLLIDAIKGRIDIDEALGRIDRSYEKDLKLIEAAKVLDISKYKVK